MKSNTLGFRIRQIRNIAKANQTEFADSIGITQSTLSSYEKGNATPSIDVLTAIARKYHVSVDWLLGINQNEVAITSIADVASFLVQLNEVSEIRYELEISEQLPNDIEANKEKWYCALKFFGNASGYPANQAICQILSAIEENRSSFESYFTSKEMFDIWKERMIANYEDQPLTKKEYPDLDTATRLKLRNEMMKKQIKEDE